MIYNQRILLTIRKDLNVTCAVKALWKRNGLKITIIFTLERNRTNVNFAHLVLPVREHMPCMRGVILDEVVK